MRGSHPKGQASVELVAVLPLVVFVLLGAAQAVVAAHAAWAAGQSAEAAARAEALGGDLERAARGRLPERLERGLRVREAGAGVEVRLAIPRLLPVDLGSVRARAAYPGQS